MREFQQLAKQEVQRVLYRRDLRVSWKAVECAPDPAFGHEAGDVYLQATVPQGDSNWLVFIYTDEAFVQLGEAEVRFELPDYGSSQDTLRIALVHFLHLALDGVPLEEAIILAKRQAGVAS